MDVLLERLGLLRLDLLQLLRLLKDLLLFGKLRFKSGNPFIFLAHSCAHFLEARIVLLDDLLELFVRKFIHGVQTEGYLLRCTRVLLLLLLRRLRSTLVASLVGCTFLSTVLLFEFLIQLSFPLVEHFC